MFCPNCGNKIDDENGISCPTCGCDFKPAKNVFGQWVTYLNTHNVPAENRQQVDRKMNMKILIPAIIIYTLFIGFIITVVGGEELSFSSDPLDTFKGDLKRNEFEEIEDNVFRRKDQTNGAYYGFNFNDDYFFWEADSLELKLLYFEDKVKFNYSTGYIDYKIIYSINSGTSECTTVPSSYAVNCSLLDADVRQSSINLQDSFEEVLNKFNMSKEDLRGDKK